MLTLIALSAALIQEPPAPPAAPEVHTRFMVMGAEGPGGLDRDGDGQITRDEFAAPMNDHFGRMDKDGDGRLSTEELTAGHGPIRGDGEHNVMIMRGPGGHGGPGVRHFERRREGGEGAAHASHGDGRTMVFVAGRPGADGEREIILHGGPGAHMIGGPGERIQIRRTGGAGGEHDLDADNDGRISEAEFSAPLREAFARMDTDRSGFIEEAERGSGAGAEVFVHRIERRPDGED